MSATSSPPSVDAIEPTGHDLLALSAGPWVVVDDGVMGGRSAGQIEQTNGVLTFSGLLSLENNGGFSSARLPLQRGLEGVDLVRIRVRGDGRRYQLRLRHGRAFDGVAWRSDFDTAEEWRIVDLPLSGFEPVFRGRAVPQAGVLRAAQVGQLGLLLADKQAGPFHLEIASIVGVRR